MKAKAKARSHLYLNKKMITLNTIKKNKYLIILYLCVSVLYVFYIRETRDDLDLYH
jgi:hypothetical protein